MIGKNSDKDNGISDSLKGNEMGNSENKGNLFNRIKNIASNNSDPKESASTNDSVEDNTPETEAFNSVKDDADNVSHDNPLTDGSQSHDEADHDILHSSSDNETESLGVDNESVEDSSDYADNVDEPLANYTHSDDEDSSHIADSVDHDGELGDDERINELDKVAHLNNSDGENYHDAAYDSNAPVDEVNDSFTSEPIYDDPHDEWGGHASTDAEGRLVDSNGNVIHGDGAGEPNPIQHIAPGDIPNVEGNEYRGEDDYFDPYREDIGINGVQEEKKRSVFASSGAWFLIGLLSLLLLGSLIYSILSGMNKDDANPTNQGQSVTVTKTEPGKTSTNTVVDNKALQDKEKANSSAMQAKDRRIKELQDDVKTAQNSAKDAQQRNKGLQSQVNKLKGQVANPRVTTETKTLPPRVITPAPETVTQPAVTNTVTDTVTNTTVRTVVTTIRAR